MNQTDKLIIDTSDHPDLDEYFTRKAAGDTCAYSGSGTLDEYANKIAVISITDIKVQPDKEIEQKPKMMKTSAVERMMSPDDEVAEGEA